MMLGGRSSPMWLVCSECNGEYPADDSTVIAADHGLCDDCHEIMLAFLARLIGDDRQLKRPAR